MSKYVILKLTSGQDVIGKKLDSDIDTIDKCIKLDHPMVVLTTTIDNGSTIVFLRSYALLAKNKQLCVSHNHVIAEYEPQKVMVDYYTTMIEYNKKYIENDMVNGMKSANMVIKNVIEKGMDLNKIMDSYDKDKEKTLDYWESLMKTDKKH